MPAHDIRCLAFGAAGGIRNFAGLLSVAEFGDEAIHFSVINILCCGSGCMWPPGIDVSRIMVRLDALVGRWIVDAHAWHSILHRNSICAGIGSKVLIKGAVLLHDDNNVFDLLARQSQGS